VKVALYLTLAASALAIGACSKEPEAAKAPPGAMENFAANRAAEEATTERGRVEAARARETAQAADARQKEQAAESMDRFDRAEAALDERTANEAR
jgi:hypothetical protein